MDNSGTNMNDETEKQEKGEERRRATKEEKRKLEEQEEQRQRQKRRKLERNSEVEGFRYNEVESLECSEVERLECGFCFALKKPHVLDENNLGHFICKKCWDNVWDTTSCNMIYCKCCEEDVLNSNAVQRCSECHPQDLEKRPSSERDWSFASLRCLDCVMRDSFEEDKNGVKRDTYDERTGNWTCWDCVNLAYEKKAIILLANKRFGEEDSSSNINLLPLELIKTIILHLKKLHVLGR